MHTIVPQLLANTIIYKTPVPAVCQGDHYMARHLQSPYRLVQLPSEVHLELPVPFWVHPAEDVQVDIGTRGLTVVVDGVLKLQRTYYLDEVQATKQGSSFKVGTWDGVRGRQQLLWVG